MKTHTAMVGRLPRVLPRPSRRYRSGRVCADEACGTILSRYNASPFCWAHEPRGSTETSRRGAKRGPGRPARSGAGR